MIQFLSKLIGVHDLVVQLVLLPFTYCPQSKELMADVRSYVIDYRIVDGVYSSFHFNSSIIMADLIGFCFYRRHFYNDDDVTIRQRQLLYKIPPIKRQIRTGFFTKMDEDTCSRISRAIWGILTHEQRTRFINVYILKNNVSIDNYLE
jgi:hypothetical protein